MFLNHVRKQKTPVTVFLVNGVRLSAIALFPADFDLLHVGLGAP